MAYYSTVFNNVLGHNNLASILNLLLIAFHHNLYSSWENLGLNLTCFVRVKVNRYAKRLRAIGFTTCFFLQAKCVNQDSRAESGDNGNLLSDTAALGAECVAYKVWGGAAAWGSLGLFLLAPNCEVGQELSLPQYSQWAFPEVGSPYESELPTLQP